METIKVGDKGVIPYALAILAQHRHGTKQLTIVARGNAIQHAIDSVELVKRYMLPEVHVVKTTIGSESVSRESVGETTVSTIEITLDFTTINKGSKN